MTTPMTTPTTPTTPTAPTTSTAPGPVPPDARAAARTGAGLSLAAGALWLLLGAESVVRGGEMHYRDPLMLVPWTVTAAAFVLLHRVQRHASGRTERVGYVLTLAAMAVAGTGQLGLVLGIDGLAVLAFPVGALLWLAALVPFGIGTARARVLPVRVGVALTLLEIGSLLTGIALSPIAGLHERGGYSAGLWKGTVLLVLAAALGTLGSSAQRRRTSSGREASQRSTASS